MTFEKTEVIQIEFPVYKKTYQSFFLRLTGSRDCIPIAVEFSREGKKDPGEIEWTWVRTMGEYRWKKIDSNDTYRSSIVQPKDDLVTPMYTFYEEIRTNPSCPHSGSLETKLTYKNSYLNRASSLLFLYHFSEKRSSPKLTKRRIEIDIKELHHRARPTEIASLLYDEDAGINMCRVSDKHIQRETIGAIKGYLQQENAKFQLREPIPKDLYDILTEAARIRGE